MPMFEVKINLWNEEAKKYQYSRSIEVFAHNEHFAREIAYDQLGDDKNSDCDIDCDQIDKKSEFYDLPEALDLLASNKKLSDKQMDKIRKSIQNGRAVLTHLDWESSSFDC